jgi:hypothetical protein
MDALFGPLSFVNALLQVLARGVMFRELVGIFVLFFLRFILRSDIPHEGDSSLVTRVHSETARMTPPSVELRV